VVANPAPTGTPVTPPPLLARLVPRRTYWENYVKHSLFQWYTARSYITFIFHSILSNSHPSYPFHYHSAHSIHPTRSNYHSTHPFRNSSQLPISAAPALGHPSVWSDVGVFVVILA
jgi:hypothetical protein